MDQDHSEIIVRNNPTMPKPGTPEHDALIIETAGACQTNPAFNYRLHLAVPQGNNQ